MIIKLNKEKIKLFVVGHESKVKSKLKYIGSHQILRWSHSFEFQSL